MSEAEPLDKMSIVFGQMGENSMTRQTAVYSGLTLAEYLRDEKHQDVCFSSTTSTATSRRLRRSARS